MLSTLPIVTLAKMASLKRDRGVTRPLLRASILTNVAGLEKLARKPTMDVPAKVTPPKSPSPVIRRGVPPVRSMRKTRRVGRSSAVMIKDSESGVQSTSLADQSQLADKSRTASGPIARSINITRSRSGAPTILLDLHVSQRPSGL